MCSKIQNSILIIPGFALGCALTLSHLTSFITTKFFINLVNLMSMGPTFWIFCVTNLVGTLFVYIMLPETMGKSLFEIQQILKTSRKDVLQFLSAKIGLKSNTISSNYDKTYLFLRVLKQLGPNSLILNKRFD